MSSVETGAAARPSFAVVVPMYNEEAGAETCVRAVTGALAKLPNRAGLIVVEDGSGDGTAAALRRSAPAPGASFTIVSHGENRGYGAALRTGVEAAAAGDFEYTLFMDSDLTNDPADIVKFAGKMADGAEVIKATRYSLGGGASGVPGYRVWISKIGNRVAGRLFGLPLHDCTNGFRAVKTSLLARMHLTERRFPIIMEELYWCRFLATRFAEVPVILTNRTAGQRPTSFVYRPSVFWQYLKYPLMAAAGRRPRGGDV